MNQWGRRERKDGLRGANSQLSTCFGGLRLRLRLIQVIKINAFNKRHSGKDSNISLAIFSSD